MGMNRDLAHLCCEYKAFDADDIADIHLLEVFVGIVTELITGYIALDVALEVLDVAERSFTHHTLGHDTSGDGNFLSVIFCVIVFDICAVSILIILCDLERVLALCL